VESISRKYVIAGCGPGSQLCLTRTVEQVVAAATVLAGAHRLLDLFPESTATRLPLTGSLDNWLERLAARPESSIVVLVSGDPGVSSLAARVLGRFGRGNCRVLPGISSVQLACAALGLAWENAAILSAHASLPTPSLADLSARDPWIVLMGARGAESYAARLAETEKPFCYVCEDLSLPTERVQRTLPRQLAELSPHPRRIVVLTENACYE
jgi:cobalt-precorrin-7 (C5)-methyltransferase